MVRLQGRGPRHRQHAHRGARPGRPAGRARLVVAQPGVGHGGRVAGELARRGLRRAPHVRGGHLGQARQHHEPLDDVGLRGEQLLAAQSQTVDEPVHEEVGPHRVEPGGRGAQELEEAQDALAGLRRDLRRLVRCDERRDHVQAPPARDLHAAGEVDRPELDRRARQRAHDGGRIRRVGEQPQPRQHVAHLGSAEEGVDADEPVRERALLEREADRAPLAADRAHEDRDLLRRGPGTDEPLDVAGDALRLRALVRALPEAHLARLGRGGLDRPRLAVGDRVDDRAGAREHALRAPERSLEADDRRVGMAAAERGRVAPGGPGAAGERLVVVGERADGGCRRISRRPPCRARAPRRRAAPRARGPAGRRRGRGGGARRRARGRAGDRAAAAGRAARGRRRRARPPRPAGARARGRAGRTRAPAGRSASSAHAAKRSASTRSSFSRSMRATTRDMSAAGLPPRSCSRSGSSSRCSSSIASRSARPSGTTNGSSPASSASSCRMRAQRSWTVWTASSSYAPSIASSRSARSRRAAAGAATSARTDSGCAPSATSRAKRSTRTVVLPVPGPATTSSGPPGCPTTRDCAGDRFGT